MKKKERDFQIHKPIILFSMRLIKKQNIKINKERKDIGIDDDDDDDGCFMLRNLAFDYMCI